MKKVAFTTPPDKEKVGIKKPHHPLESKDSRIKKRSHRRSNKNPPLALITKAIFQKSRSSTPTTPAQPLPEVGEDPPNTPKRPTACTKLSWTTEDMAKALHAREHGLSLNKCSIQFGISRGAIANWEEGRTRTKRKGPPTTLTTAEEEPLLQWIFLKCDSGHGVSVTDVKLKAA
ncbi:hypothetical protein GOP47_0002462 [Adiantum capillus-veneris]|uniref:HTH CENPB-type domain-containing protein n=1 Tax=Adiantum capillus-veneris TaxID=13818 RepID=A0A9D4ZP78_ADICA|nr:hypothetical protein GOP47_0002462 [Adiantum capillus-veneris]